MATVKILKFMNGQEVIAKVLEETATEIQITSPLMLQPVRVPNSPEGLTISLMPFSWGGLVNAVTLKKDHVLCMLTVEPQLESQYLAGLAGIALPDSLSSAKTPKLTLVE